MYTFKIRIAGQSITVLTHDMVDIDEIASSWLAELYGDMSFISEYCSDGKLVLGIDGGPFDEHAVNGNGSKKGDCCTTLVAKALKVENDPKLIKIIKYIYNVDTNADGPYGLANTIKKLHYAHPNNPDFVVTLAKQGLSAKLIEFEPNANFTIGHLKQLMWHEDKEKNVPDYKLRGNEWSDICDQAWFDAQLAFQTTVMTEYQKVAKVEKINGIQDECNELTLVSMKTENNQMNQFARTSRGGKADIIIQQNNAGNVQIFTSKSSWPQIRLADVLRMLNYVEQELAKKILVTDWQELAAEGFINNEGRWYFFKNGNCIFNGSKTNPDVPPTRIPFNLIIEIIKIALDPNCFEPSFANNCKTGKCLSTAANPCPFYAYGFDRCRDIRRVKYMNAK